MLLLTLLPKQWRAEVSLLLNPSGPEVLDEVDGVEEELDSFGYRQYYRTQREVLSSRTVAEASIARLGLAEDPEFLGVDHIHDANERAEAAAEIDPVERLREIVSIREVNESRVVRIRVEYPDPERAAEIANTLAATYLEYITGERVDDGARAQRDLGKELSEARTRLRAAERALADFKTEHAITTIALEDRQSVVTTKILELSEQAQAAQAARIAAEDLYDEAKRLHAKGAYSGAAALLDPSQQTIFDDLLRERLAAQKDFLALDLRYGDQHPSWREANERHALIDATIEAEADSHLATFAARYRAAKATQVKLEAALKAEQNRALELSELEPEYRELARAVADAEDIYGVLARRDTEVGLTNRVEGRPPVEILDPATAGREPVRPRMALGLAAAGLIGLVLGGLGAVAVDLRDYTIRELGDLELAVAGWDLPVLGQLPRMPLDPKLGGANHRDQRRHRDLHTHAHPQSPMAEQARGIRAAVSFALSRQEQHCLLVTSPASSEGKSSTALNLALSWCQAGKRVVLVDADMRRPRLHEVFAMPLASLDHGLATVLTGGSTLDDALVPGEALDGAPESLSILPCGPLPATPAELLDGHGFRRTLAELRQRFDVVIFDTPPLMPVVDALILARQVDGVVLVARCGASSRADVQRSLGLLRRHDTNLLGLVLNDVELRERSGYYRYGEYSARSA